MRELEALRQLTTLFPLFLGLRLLPVGLWFVLVSMGFGQFPSALHGLLMVVAAAATWAIHRGYRERYGVVEPERLRFGRNWALLAGLTAAYLALAVGAARLGPRPLVIVLVVIVFATGALYALPRFLSGARLAAGFGVVAVSCAALVAALPRDPARLGEVGWMFSLALGLALSIAGWAEHRSLVRALSAADETGDA